MADMKKPHTGSAYGIISKISACNVRSDNKPHTGALDCLKECHADRSGIDDAIHCALGQPSRVKPFRAARKRPLRLEAPKRLFNSLNVPDRTVGAFGEGDGVTPVCFYHRSSIDQSAGIYKLSDFWGGFA